MARSLPILHTSAAPSVQPRTARVSLTDRCDLACVYCRPNRRDGYVERRLDLDAWRTMIDGLVRAGIRRVRITGGEPLLHPDVIPLVRHLAAVRTEDGPLEDIALTTNATRLAALAAPLAEAGLRRINISLDTLDDARFFRMTRGGRLSDVLDGIEAARRAGLAPIKLNTVVVRGENDDEVETLIRWAWERGLVPRMLEVMLIGEGARLAGRVVPGAEIRAHLAHLLDPDGPATREPGRGPAKYVHARHDPSLRVGFITGTSDTYCKDCDRLRVASDGMLRPCLATNDGLSASHAARSGAEHVADAVERAWALKPDGDTWKGCTEDTAAHVSIRAIGG